MADQLWQVTRGGGGGREGGGGGGGGNEDENIDIERKYIYVSLVYEKGKGKKTGGRGGRERER